MKNLNLSLSDELLLQAVLDGKAEPTKALVKAMYEGFTTMERELRYLQGLLSRLRGFPHKRTYKQDRKY